MTDFGNETTVPLHPPSGNPPLIRSLPDNPSSSLPIVAHHCCLRGFQDLEDNEEPLQIATAFFDESVPGEKPLVSVKFVSDDSRKPDPEEPSLVTLTYEGKDVGESIMLSMQAANLFPTPEKSTLRPVISEESTSTLSPSVKAAVNGEIGVSNVLNMKVEKIPVGQNCDVYFSHKDGIDSIYFQSAA